MLARPSSRPFPAGENAGDADRCESLPGEIRSTRRSCNVRGGGTASGQWKRQDLPARMGSVPAGVTSGSTLALGSGRTKRLGKSARRKTMAGWRASTFIERISSTKTPRLYMGEEDRRSACRTAERFGAKKRLL
eukprot:scaffold74475_cov32-Tisochrysis_lutea.AAC.5